MKKVLLSSVAALAVFAAAAPVFAQGENTNNSNALTQLTYVDERAIADEANTQVAAHDSEIRAEAQRQFDQGFAAAAIKKAEANLKAFLDSGYSGHDFTDKKNALEAEVATAKKNGEKAYNEIYNTVRNRYVQKLQEDYREAAKREGRYWDDASGKNGNLRADVRKANNLADQGKGNKPADNTNGGKTTPASTNEAKATEGKATKSSKDGKAASAQAGKALPKTSAVK